MDIGMTEPVREQSRARYPDTSDYVKRNGVRLYYEVYGSGEPLLIVHGNGAALHSLQADRALPQSVSGHRDGQPRPGQVRG